jgi:GntR family transcriptional regulator
MQIEPIAFEMRPCPSDIAVALGLGEGAPVRYVARLRLADAVPIAIDQRYVPGTIAAGIRRSGAMRSILHTLWDQHELSHGELELEASSAGPDEARWLRIAEGSPIMLRRLRYFTREGMPILAGRSCYRADLVRYSIHVPLSREFRSTLEPFARSEEAPRQVRLRREIAPR